MPTVFFTGFPGFLGSQLLPRVFERSPEDRAVCLVQSKFISQAHFRLERIEQAHPHLRGRIDLAPRDYFVDAMSHLSGLETSAGKVSQLVAPGPLTVSQLVKLLERATRRRIVRIHPLRLRKYRCGSRRERSRGAAAADRH